jgi:hypothetical protein
VGVAQVRTVEFEAKYLGDWMLHCHLPHHMMNQMVSMVGPMSHSGHTMPAGLSMESGMGMLSQGHALSDEAGPGLGRGMGLAADREQRTRTVAQHNNLRRPMTTDFWRSRRAGDDPNSVPGYPQVWMPMDHDRPAGTSACVRMDRLDDGHDDPGEGPARRQVDEIQAAIEDELGIYRWATFG